MSKISIAALAISNAIPLLGVLLYDWTVSGVLLLYFIETLIIGFFITLRLRKSELMPGFIIVSLFFAIIHGIFLFIFFEDKLVQEIGPLSHTLIIGSIILFASNAIYHFFNYKNTELEHKRKFVARHIKRIQILHLTIIIGVALFSDSLITLLIMIAIKTLFDMKLRTTGQ